MTRSWKPVLGLALSALLSTACATGDTGMPIAAEGSVASRYTSPLGYSAIVPDDWMVLTRETIASGDLLDALQGEAESGALEGFDASILDGIRQTVEKGQLDLIFPRLTLGAPWNDNVNVTRAVGQLPRNEAELDANCEALSKQMREAGPHDARVEVCELRRVGPREVMHTRGFNLFPDVHTIQWFVSMPHGALYIVTLSAKGEAATTLLPPVEALVASFESAR